MKWKAVWTGRWWVLKQDANGKSMAAAGEVWQKLNAAAARLDGEARALAQSRSWSLALVQEVA